MTRCFWCDSIPELITYHDEEWGFPVSDDTRLFEKICLEGFQSGLSWRTVLNKRDRFREVFHGFDIECVARFRERDIERLLQDRGIIRHRGKIEAAINNAKRARELIKETGSLAAHIWSFEPAKSSRPASIDTNFLKTTAQTEDSRQLSKALKRRGWKFVGPTTMYAFMQSVGLVNDHESSCPSRAKVEQARKRFNPPR